MFHKCLFLLKNLLAKLLMQHSGSNDWMMRYIARINIHFAFAAAGVTINHVRVRNLLETFNKKTCSEKQDQAHQSP